MLDSNEFCQDYATMENLVLFSLIVAAFAMALPGADAVKCYNCVSGVDSGCDDPFKASSSIPTCSGEYCSKTYASTNGKVNLKVQSLFMLTIHQCITQSIVCV
jgi:hypothetical protein